METINNAAENFKNIKNKQEEKINKNEKIIKSPKNHDNINKQNIKIEKFF